MDKENEAGWQFNRLGLTATGIFIQVTVAKAMFGLTGISEVSIWVASRGILQTFLLNSIQ